MLFLLALYYLTYDGVDAVPIPFQGLTASPCSDLTQCRTIWDIIWSCLVTIFACTWAAVHPNIKVTYSKKPDSWFRRWFLYEPHQFISKRVPLFITALLVPEYILSWAVRQHLVAKEFDIGPVEGYLISSTE
jgi:hypothetical protein